MTSNKAGLLSRVYNLLGPRRPPVVAELYAAAIGQPLLVEPVQGESLLHGYMAGAVDVPPALVESCAASAAAGVGAASGESTEPVIRVLNISGALINRPKPGLCDPGPLSYEAIGEAFDAAIADDQVGAVILRMSSPGGMAAGCFDLADRMMAARGQKPIYAIADDYAYSACYGLAAAADEIWVTRTAGVGSVGVICWHVDQSQYNAKVGLAVTPIYSGARKADFSPHQPLADEAKTSAQASIDQLRELFVESVARYRGLSAEAVYATEAGTFNGQDAIDAGLADKLGTMRDLLAHVRATLAAPEPTPAASRTGDQPAAIGAGADERAQDTKPDDQLAARAALADALAESSLAPVLVRALLGVPMAEEEIPARLKHAAEVADLCAAARLDSCAEGYVKSHTAIETVRAELLGAVADVGPEVSTAHPGTAPATGGREPSRTERIYNQRRAAAAGLG